MFGPTKYTKYKHFKVLFYIMFLLSIFFQLISKISYQEIYILFLLMELSMASRLLIFKNSLQKFRKQVSESNYNNVGDYLLCTLFSPSMFILITAINLFNLLYLSSGL